VEAAVEDCKNRRRESGGLAVVMGKEDEMHRRTVSRRKEAANPRREVREDPWFGRKRAAKLRERYCSEG
jgi:hypothetical protein